MVLLDGGKWGERRVAAAAAAKSPQLCLTLCDPIDGSPPGLPVPGILQARTLEWAAISFFNAWKWKVKSETEVAQSCPTLSGPMDCSLPDSSVHGIFQARVLEWVAIAFSREELNVTQKKREREWVQWVCVLLRITCNLPQCLSSSLQNWMDTFI